MSATTKPAFHAMSIQELVDAKTALEVKLTSADKEDRAWILDRFDQIVRKLQGEPVGMPISQFDQYRQKLETKMGSVDYESRDWVLGLFDEVIGRVKSDQTTDTS